MVATPNPIVRMTQSHIVVDAGDPEIGPLQYEFRVAQGPEGGYVIQQGNEAIYNSPNNLGLAIIQVTVTMNITRTIKVLSKSECSKSRFKMQDTGSKGLEMPVSWILILYLAIQAVIARFVQNSFNPIVLIVISRNANQGNSFIVIFLVLHTPCPQTHLQLLWMLYQKAVDAKNEKRYSEYLQLA